MGIGVREDKDTVVPLDRAEPARPQFRSRNSARSLTEPRLLPSQSRCLLAVTQGTNPLFLSRAEFSFKASLSTKYSNNQPLSFYRHCNTSLCGEPPGLANTYGC